MKLLTILSILPALTVTLFAESLPYDVENLQHQREQRIAEIDKIYRKELESLKLKYTKSGNLPVANAIAELIEELVPLDLPKTDEELREFLAGTTWEFDGERSITFLKNGKIKKSWGQLEPKWKVKDMKVYFEIKVIEFDETYSTAKEIKQIDLKGKGKLVSSR